MSGLLLQIYIVKKSDYSKLAWGMVHIESVGLFVLWDEYVKSKHRQCPVNLPQNVSGSSYKVASVSHQYSIVR